MKKKLQKLSKGMCGAASVCRICQQIGFQIYEIVSMYCSKQRRRRDLFDSRSGSALLITLLLLGALMTLVLGVSSLVIREIVVTQSVVDANKAYYAAEAGVEHALFELKNNYVGSEPEGSWPKPGNTINPIDPDFKFDYSTSNKTDSVPGFPDDNPIFVETVSVPDAKTSTDCRLVNARTTFAFALNKEQFYEECPRATYRKLGLNETHIIPLYSANPDGSTEKVKDFLVEYYLNVRDGSSFYGVFTDMKLEYFDVLRWKLYGKPSGVEGVQKTESIADFYPGVTNNGPNTPVCIGTNSTVRSLANESCIFPSLSKKPPSDASDGTANLNDVTLWSAARECYMTDAGKHVTGGSPIKGTTLGGWTGCQMRDFIDSHEENYLILTNMVNPEILGIANINDPLQLSRADIYYRVLAKSGEGNPKLVKDFAEISSSGFAAGGRVVKNLFVRYKPPGFLPVFNFSLYKTKSPPDPKSSLSKRNEIIESKQ